MDKKIFTRLLWASFSILVIFYIWGINTVPFHPDESSYLFQSQEFKILLTDPLSLAWAPEKAIDPLLRYRLLDAPLHRYTVGLGRWIAGFNATSLPNDWNWSLDWEKNIDAGAMPDPKLLFTARMVSTIFTLGAILFIYLFTKRLAGNTAGLIAALLFGINGLTLLHGRRAMAEGVLFFGISIALWSIWQAKKRPWLTGISFAIAACAKYSLVVLFPIGLIAVIWLTLKGQNWRKLILKNTLAFLISFGMICWLLHPVLWLHPIAGLQEMLKARLEFTNSGIGLFQTIGSNQLMNTAGQKFNALLAQLLIAPPAYADVGNYIKNTAQSVLLYEANTLHNLLRNFLGGGILMILSIFGFIISFIQFNGMLQVRKIILILFFALTLVQGITLVLMLPIAFQRYYLPLLPIISIWAGLGLNSFLVQLNILFSKTK